MSVRIDSECLVCGAGLSMRPFYAEGKDYCVWVATCTNCGSIQTKPSKEALEDPDYDEGLAAALVESKRPTEEEWQEAYRPHPRGRPDTDGVHRCETCQHYADKLDGMGGRVVYCTKRERYLVDRRAQPIVNPENDCEDWKGVVA